MSSSNLLLAVQKALGYVSVQSNEGLCRLLLDAVDEAKSETEDDLENLDCMEDCPENLDCMGPDELVQLSRELRTLAEYATVKATGIRCRLAGDLTLAVMNERAADCLYALLPERLRW